MPSSPLILCRPLLLLPPIPPSIRVFSNESTLCMRWSKYWSFSFSIIPSKEIPGLISFRMDWLDLLAVQGTLKSLLQHHSSKASILRGSAFFTVQLSHPYKEGSGPWVLLKSGPGNRGRSACGPTHVARLEFPREAGLLLPCAGQAGNPFQTTQGNRLSCRDQEGRRGSEDGVPGPSVFPSGEPGVSGTLGGRRKAVRDRFALQGGAGDFP